MLKLKLKYFGHLLWRMDSLEKTLMLEKIEGRRRRGWQDEMVGWHQWLDEHEFQQALGIGDGQESLVCRSPWGLKELDMTEQWTELNPKVSQPWIFIGRTQAEAPILWPPNAKKWLIGKGPDAGKDWRHKEKGMTGWDGWMASPTWWTWEAWCAAAHGVAKSQVWLSDWNELNYIS